MRAIITPATQRIAINLMAVIVALVVVSGCGAKQARPATPAEIEMFVRDQMQEATTQLALNPPQAAVALDHLEQVLELDDTNAQAWMLKADALFELRRYYDALCAIEEARELDGANQDIMYRVALINYHYKNYWRISGYDKARDAARACLGLGSRYLVECYTILRNVELAEDANNGPSVEAYRRAETLALELLGRLEPNHSARGDVLLVLADYHENAFNSPSKATDYLAQAKTLASNDPGLARRIAAFEADRALRDAIGDRPPVKGSVVQAD